jgi:hypothetical protein
MSELHDPDSPYEDEARTTFRRHEIHVSREPECNWYIRVMAPSGLYAYDGYWSESWNRTRAEAIEEARRGALLLPRDGAPAPKKIGDPYDPLGEVRDKVRAELQPMADLFNRKADKK